MAKKVKPSMMEKILKTALVGMQPLQVIDEQGNYKIELQGHATYINGTEPKTIFNSLVERYDINTSAKHQQVRDVVEVGP